MKFKMVALDVDGTLMNDDHEIMPLTKQIIRDLADLGLMIVLCTGRGPQNTLPVLEQLGISGYMLNHNGGVIARSEPLQWIRQETFELSLIAPILDYCRSAGVHFDLCTAFTLYCETLTPYEKEMYDAFLLTPVMVDDVLRVQEPPVKLTLFGPEAVMDAAEQFCRTIAHPLRMIRSDRRFIDFMLPGVSKGSALAALCATYGIVADEVIAIGNYFNDEEMIAFAGVGVAMANSPDGLKATADDVTRSNNEEGVYHALRKYVLTK